MPRLVLSTVRRLAMIFVAVAIGACASSYVAVGVDGGTSPDASTTATGTGTSTPPFDASGPPPAPLEAGADAAPASPCVPGHGHYLCADFDTGGFEAFDEQNVTVGGNLEIATSLSVSPPRALKATVPRRGATGADALARVEKLLVGWKRTRIEYDVRIESTDGLASDNGVSLGGIFMSSSSAFTGSLVFTDGINTAISIESTSSRYIQTKGHIGSKKWVHIVIDLDPTRGKLDYVVDGMADSQTFQVPALNGSNPTTQVAFGFTSFEGPSPSLGIYFDNIVVDIF